MNAEKTICPLNGIQRGYCKGCFFKDTCAVLEHQKEIELTFIVCVSYNYEGSSCTQYGKDREEVTLKEVAYLYAGYSLDFFDPETGKAIKFWGKEFNKTHRELILSLVHNTSFEEQNTWKPERVFKTWKKRW